VRSYAGRTRYPYGHFRLVVDRLVFSSWLGQLRLFDCADSAGGGHSIELGDDSSGSVRGLQSATLGLVDRTFLKEN
jgi:hypothetical protein